MGEITDLRVKGERVEVCIDGKLSFSISAALANGMQLSIGQILSADEIQDLIEVEATGRCFDAALRLLSYRPRSRNELRQRLIKRGFSEIVVDRTILVLEQRGLIDDRAFAQYWTDNRVQFKPKSARLISLELKQKGVSPEVVDEVTELLDEESLAYHAAVKKTRFLANCSDGESCKRLYEYLRRRGFGDAVIRSVLRRLVEVHNTNSDQSCGREKATMF